MSVSFSLPSKQYDALEARAKTLRMTTPQFLRALLRRTGRDATRDA